MTNTIYTNGGLIVKKRKDGDIELMNKDTNSKLFLSQPELQEIAEKTVNQ